MRKFVAAIIATLIAVNAVFAASPAAVFYGNGEVTVNGTGVARSVAVFAGDKIQTGEGAGTISFSGSSVLVHKSSRVGFDKDAVEIFNGGVTVKTMAAFAARVAGLEVRPTGNASRFTVTNDGKLLTVTALEGSLAVGAGLTVPQGKTIVLAAVTPAATPQRTSCVEGKKVDESGKFLLDNVGRYIACVDQVSSGGGAVVVTETPTWQIAAGFAAAGAAGTAAAVYVAQKNKSDN